MTYKIISNKKTPFLVILIIFLAIFALPNWSYSQTFNVSELDFVSTSTPSYKIDSNNNIHILYMTGNEFGGQLYYRNSIGNKVTEFNEPILIDEFGMLNNYEIELYPDGSPYFIYAYQTDEYDEGEGTYVQIFNVKYAEIGSNSLVRIDTIFHTNHIISGFKTKSDNSGILHGCFVIDSTHTTDMNIYYVYDILGNNTQFTHLSPSSYYSNTEIHIDSNNFAHIFYNVRNKDKNEYSLAHAVQRSIPIVNETLVTYTESISFKSAIGDNDILGLIYLKDSLYYTQFNEDHSFSRFGLYIKPNINLFRIQSIAIGDSTVMVLAGQLFDKLTFTIFNIFDVSKLINIPFFDHAYQKITIDNNGVLYGLLYNFPDMANAPIYSVNSKLALDPLPNLPPLPPFIRDTSICQNEILNINISGIDLKWYEDSVLSQRIFRGDSITINNFNPIVKDYFVTESILDVESLPYKFRVTVNALPDIELGPDTAITVQDTILLETNSNNYSYVWQNGDTLVQHTIIASEIGIGIFKYNVIATDSNFCSYSDSILITITDVTSFSDYNSNSFSVYPIPSKSLIYLDLNDIVNQILEINIYDNIGTLIYQKSKGILDIEYININTFKSGIYFIKINTNSRQFIKTIIKI